MFGLSAASTFFWASQATFVLVLGMLSYAAFAFNVVLLDRVLPALGHGCLVPVLRYLFGGLWLLTIWSFVRARCADPGVLPEAWKAFVSSSGLALPIAPPKREWQPRKATMCMTCHSPRPERAHHCTLCNCCVLRYDHHCPWISNCVGFHNHKFFMLLSVYAWSLGVLALLVSVPLLPTCFHGLVAGSLQAYKDLESGPWHEKELNAYDALAVFFLTACGVMACTLLTTVLRIHLPLSLQNSTSVEAFYGNMPNPFDQSSVLLNVAQTFGQPGLDWFLPISPLRPLSDGVTFPLTGEAAGMASGREACDCLLEDSEGDESSPRGSSRPASGEDVWRTRYRLHSRLDPWSRSRGEAGPSPAAASPSGRAGTLLQCEGETSPSSPTLLTGLWRSFFRPRRSAKTAVWL